MEDQTETKNIKPESIGLSSAPMTVHVVLRLVVLLNEISSTKSHVSPSSEPRTLA